MRRNVKEKTVDLSRRVNGMRKSILEMAVRAGSGHIASAFSCTEILVALYHGGLLKVDPKKPGWKERDRFVLSKGHAAMALYAVLADRGYFRKSDLKKFGFNKTNLGAHPDDGVPGVDVLTGSLGHGLSIGAGIALGAKLSNKKYSVVVLMGDGECHEGSVWEAAMFSAHHQLNNLVAIIDYNQLCATDLIKDCLNISPLEKKWEAFGWDVELVDGHSLNSFLEVFRKIRNRNSSRPAAIIAVTTKGKGVSFMENVPLWHYRIPVGDELKIARRELTGL